MTATMRQRVAAAGLALGAAGVAGCTVHTVPTLAPGTVAAPSERIPKRVLLMVSQDFETFSHAVSYRHYDFSFEAGKGAVPSLIDLLGRTFAGVTVERVSSNGAAYLKIGNGLSADVDYVAIPHFIDTRSRVRDFSGLKVETGIRLELVSRDRSRMVTAVGRGTSEHISLMSGDVHDAGRESLRDALIALRDDLVAKRDSL